MIMQRIHTLKLLSYIDYVMLALLVFSLMLPSIIQGNITVSTAYGLFLWGAAWLVLYSAQALHIIAAHIMRFCFIGYSLSESVTYGVAGVHINWFLAHAVIKDSFIDTGHIGIGLDQLLGFVIVVVFVFCFWSYLVSKRLNRQTRHQTAPMIALTVIAFLAAQTSYAIGYFSGNIITQNTKRTVPLFWYPHPYYIKIVLEPLLGPMQLNPFSLPYFNSQAMQIPNIHIEGIKAGKPKNILVIVIDSLRSQELKQEDPLLPITAPNLMQLGEIGQISLDHQSVSNCTHFSFYTMFSGKLPIDYGLMRSKAPMVQKPLQMLQSAGYDISTSEAVSLDWYDIASLVFGGNADRWIAPNMAAVQRDAATAQHTRTYLQTRINAAKPFFHITYFNSVHYPYDRSVIISGDAQATYKKAIQSLDSAIGNLISNLKSDGTLVNTLVIITSDHGEHVGDSVNNITGHMADFTDTLTRVPFIVLGANGNLPTGHRDLMPFIAREIDLMSLDGTPALPRPKQPSDPIILAQCDYAYPMGFAVLDQGTRVDFSFDDGLLTPITQGVSDHDINKAIQTLLEEINRPH